MYDPQTGAGDSYYYTKVGGIWKYLCDSCAGKEENNGL
jgi:hypothetical protein